METRTILIMTFKQLLNRERQRLLDLRNRYVGGLEQLAFAEKQVDQYKPQKIVEGQKVEHFIPAGGEQVAWNDVQKQ